MSSAAITRSWAGTGPEPPGEVTGGSGRSKARSMTWRIWCRSNPRAVSTLAAQLKKLPSTGIGWPTPPLAAASNSRADPPSAAFMAPPTSSIRSKGWATLVSRPAASSRPSAARNPVSIASGTSLMSASRWLRLGRGG